MRRLLLVCISLLLIISCNQTTSRNVSFFKGTEAYELARSVEQKDLTKIEEIVESSPGLLETSNPITGSNVLALCLYIENFESFEKLLEMGANPDFINPLTKYSILMDACMPFGSSADWIIDIRYAETLLRYGANPNYAVYQDFVNEKQRHIIASSPLIRASSLNLELVKLLIRNGADIDQVVGDRSPFSEAVASGKFDIIYYYIDSLGVDVRKPLKIRSNDSLYVQDYIMKFMSYKEGSGSYIQKQALQERLETMGIDFENYNYKLK